MAHFISDECVACGTCLDECPNEAIKEGDIYEGTADLVLYAQYERITVKLVPIEGSTTVVDRNGVRESYNDGTDRDEGAYTPVNGVPYETESFDYHGIEKAICGKLSKNEEYF